MNRKVMVVGLDSAPGEIVFDRRDEFPVLKELIENGFYGNLRSSDPPITIPAWMVMCTGIDSGKLGLYGFRHRKDYSYKNIWIATSQSIEEKPIWDFIGEKGGRSCLVSIPPSYPPHPVHGDLISCFITPGNEKEYTYPPELARELEEKFGPYIFDVVFRTDQKEDLLEQINTMTEQHFKILNYLVQRRSWDFFMFVEIGVDRIQHAFWKYMDPGHHLYVKGNRYEDVILDYYRDLDSKIGKLLLNVDKDTVVLVVSDHGAKKMKGAFCINEWLIDEGDLVVKERPSSPVSLEKVDVDWSRSKVWGWGGYYARLFLNIDGREAQGIIDPQDYEKERDILIGKLRNIRGPQGEKWNTHIIKPQQYFKEANGDYPDLMVYFDDLDWRSAGTLGHNTQYLLENDTGPDDAVHALDGIFILYDPRSKESQRRNASILDVAPTILQKMGIPIPEHMRGEVIGNR